LFVARLVTDAPTPYVLRADSLAGLHAQLPPGLVRSKSASHRSRQIWSRSGSRGSERRVSGIYAADAIERPHFARKWILPRAIQSTSQPAPPLSRVVVSVLRH